MTASCSPRDTSNPTSQDTETSVAAAAEQSLAVEAISFDDKECADQGFPIALSIKNNREKPTIRVRWQFSVFKKGHSTDLAGYKELVASASDPNRITDRIIEPGKTLKVCSTAPSIDGDYAQADLDYRVTVVPEPNNL